MAVKKTLVGHFWNEQYLLPWWIKHHREMFDEAILLNYGSTDRSMHEIKKHAPSSWKVVDSRHQMLSAAELEKEIQEIESGISGWRICLTIAEFLFGSLDRENMMFPINHSYQPGRDNRAHFVPCFKVHDWNPEGSLDHKTPLSMQSWMGLDCRLGPGENFNIRPPRLFHNIDGLAYPVGRHYWGHEAFVAKEMVIVHYANSISSPDMLARRLSMQTKISDSDKLKGLGVGHYVSATQPLVAADVEHQVKTLLPNCIDIRPHLELYSGK